MICKLCGKEDGRVFDQSGIFGYCKTCVFMTVIFGDGYRSYCGGNSMELRAKAVEKILKEQERRERLDLPI